MRRRSTTCHSSSRRASSFKRIAAAASPGPSRRVFEQTAGRVQQLVIDSEGEFATLREKLGFVPNGR
jgi:hypothetical protein